MLVYGAQEVVSIVAIRCSISLAWATPDLISTYNACEVNKDAERRATTGNVGQIVSRQRRKQRRDSLAGLRGLDRAG
jgi:hypothetical protein